LSVLDVTVPAVFEPLLGPASYKGAHGGRGSGKSHFFAERLVIDSLCNPGLRSVCIREVQKSLKDSAKRLIEDKIQALGLGPHFEVLEKEIRTPGNGIITFQGMQDHTAESIKSLEGFKRAWIEEAQSLSARSLGLLRPTIRDDDAEIWASWNPRRKTDAIEVLLRGDSPPPGSAVVKVDWRDNPFFPSRLDQERRYDLTAYPDQYEHVWEGGYVSVFSGSYFAAQLNEAKDQGRIGAVAPDPLMTFRAYWDIGGTGAKADATAIWIVQIIGPQRRVLNYYEAQGQPLASHVNWLRDNGYGKALCILPHDGAAHDKIADATYEGALKQAGFEVRVIPNQGRGAAMARVQAVRRQFPNIWFNAATTEAGRDALGAYHERKDEVRGVGLGPEHDWASHGADAFGLMCIDEQVTETSWGASIKVRTRVV
jgi:phage terminase large subunit